MNLTSWIITGLISGIITGLFFGDMCANLKVIGEIFIQLLQMTILPYIITSLIVGIGGLSFKEARNLAMRGGVLLFIFWGAILLVVFLMPMVFPVVKTASFFSSSMIAKMAETNYMNLYIPSNPFSSLANSMIPAVVLFGICVGVALISMEEKKSLLDVLSTARDALTKVAKAVVYLTPIGVFAFAANAAGTMTIEEIARLQVFFITFIMVALILTFLIFPMLVTSFTPFKYRQVISISRAALITAFTTGNLFIVLPLITEKVKTLLASEKNYSKDNHALPEVIIPVTFNFPDAGQLSSVLFILFGSWFAGSLLAVSEWPGLAISGLLSFFGGANLAIPYMLEQYKLSMDYFQLYIMAGIINGYFATMAAAMHLICFTIICAYSMSHGVKISVPRIVTNVAISFGVIILLLVGSKIYLAKTVEGEISQKSVLEKMEIKNPVIAKIDTKYPERSILDKMFEKKNAPNRLKRIKKNGVIKVGYNCNTMPFAFFNEKEELIGYDIQMAHNLARDLDCDIEFVPFDFPDMEKALDNNVIDIAMSGVYVSLERIFKVDFTDTYMEIHMALIVKDHRKGEFKDIEKIKRTPGLKLAILKGNAFTEAVKDGLPEAEIIEIDNYEDFFNGKIKADALVHSAEQGSTWALKYPSYSVVLVHGSNKNTSVSYAIAKGDLPFLEYLNYWLKIQKWNDITDENYDYWVEGKVPGIKKPRWCIIRDVFHWVD